MTKSKLKSKGKRPIQEPQPSAPNAPSERSAAQVEEANYKGWKCLKLSNADTEVCLAPEIGGRIIQYVYMGHPFLWVNKKLEGKIFPISENNKLENWKSYGGDKVWLAPQGWDDAQHWPGPGDDVMDAPFTAEIVKKSGDYVQVKMTGSATGGYAGIQYITEVTLFDGSSRVYFKTTMKNVSKKETNWGIWRVTQMDFTGSAASNFINDKAYIVVPMNPKSIWPEKFHIMFGLAESLNWKPNYSKMQMIVKFMNMVGKIGMDTYNGWAAMVDDASGFTYVQRWETFPGSKYPDNSTFYAWVAGKGEYIHKHKFYTEADNPDNPDSRLIEMEILSPYMKLKPGETYGLNSSWEASKGGLDSVARLKDGFIPAPSVKK
jgi:hypothetical protein